MARIKGGKGPPMPERPRRPTTPARPGLLSRLLGTGGAAPRPASDDDGPRRPADEVVHGHEVEALEAESAAAEESGRVSGRDDEASQAGAGSARPARPPGFIQAGAGGALIAFGVLTWTLTGALATGEDADVAVVERIVFGAIPFGLPALILGAMLLRRGLAEGGRPVLRPAAIAVLVIMALSGVALLPLLAIGLAMWLGEMATARRFGQPPVEAIAGVIVVAVPIYVIAFVLTTTPAADLEVTVAHGACSLVDGDLVATDDAGDPVVQDGDQWVIEPESDRYSIEVTNDDTDDAVVRFDGVDVDDEPGSLDLAVPPGETVRGVLPELGEGDHALECGPASSPAELTLTVKKPPE